jgi:hypothetical protein
MAEPATNERWVATRTDPRPNAVATVAAISLIGYCNICPTELPLRGAICTNCSPALAISKRSGWDKTRVNASSDARSRTATVHSAS